MNYYRRYVGDYMRDTMHLSVTEHGAYMLLLDATYATEKPLPADYEALYRICRATSKVERAAVKSVADQFFKIGADDLRHNPRADRELGIAQSTIEKQRTSGAASANKRWSTDVSMVGQPMGQPIGQPINQPSVDPPTSNGLAIQPPTTNQKHLKSTTLSGKPDPVLNGHAVEFGVLTYLNEKTGHHYRPQAVNINLITARLKDGATPEELCAVIDGKCEQWLGDKKMARYLRPATLFNATKFAQYQGEVDGPRREVRRAVV